MKIKNFLLGTIIAAVGGLSISAAVNWQSHLAAEQARNNESSCQTAKSSSAAVWKEVYKTPDQLIAGVDKIVLAEAVGVTPSRVAFSENSEDELPFELVAFRVSNPVKAAKDDETVYVERAVGIDVDGGDFETGKSYLLFLKQQEQGPYFYQVNDQGRYNVVGEELKAIGGDETDTVKDFFKNKNVREAIRSVKEKKEK
jgi:hypothetical protein